MNMYWFLYDANGVIQQKAMSGVNPWPNPPATWSVISFDQATASATVVMAFNYPSRYLYQNGAFVEQPFFTLSAASSSGTITLTATLNSPPATAPTSCTFSILGQSVIETLTNNTATLILAVHPSIASQQLSVSVAETGCVQATATAGGTSSGIPLQAYQDALKNWHIAPTLKSVLQGYYASLVPEQLVAANTLVGISLLADVVFNVLLTPAVIAALTANQQSAINDFKANISGVLPITLANAYPSEGVKEIHYESFEANMPTYAESVTGYNADVVNIPNLV